MKCTNCGTDFSGDVCPNCQKPATERTEDNRGSKHIRGPKRKKIVPVRLIGEIAGGILLVIFVVTTIVFKVDYSKLVARYDSLAATNAEAKSENTELTANLTQIKAEYDKYKSRMKPYEKLDEAEAKARQIQAEKVAADKKAAEEKAIADKKAAEEKAAADAAAAKAAEKARGYETGITYDQLARTPDSFKGQKVKFTGKVVQVMEKSGIVQIRLAVGDNYDTILLGTYSSSIVPSRILEDDHITIYGTSTGTVTYKSTMGGNITIPGVRIAKIDQ